MQLLLRRQAKSLPDAEWQDFLELRSHLDDFRSSCTKNTESLTTWQTIELMSQAALTYSGSREPLALIQALTARVCSLSSHFQSTVLIHLGPHQYPDADNSDFRSLRPMFVSSLFPDKSQL